MIVKSRGLIFGGSFNPWDEEISIPETLPIRKSFAYFYGALLQILKKCLFLFDDVLAAFFSRSFATFLRNDTVQFFSCLNLKLFMPILNFRSRLLNQWKCWHIPVSKLSSRMFQKAFTMSCVPSPQWCVLTIFCPENRNLP